MLIYFLKGNLPWKGIKTKNKEDKNRLIREKKMEYTFENLCSGIPLEFQYYFKYCNNLKFEQKPDYGYLKKILKELFIKKGSYNL